MSDLQLGSQKNEFVHDPNPYSYNETPNFFNQPPQPQTCPCEFCGNNDHYGYDCPPQVSFIYNPEPCYNHDFDNDFPTKEKQHQPEDIQELLHKLLKDLQIISEELAEYINSPSWNCPTFYDDDDEYTIQYKEYLENSSNAITPVLPTEEPNNSLIRGFTTFSNPLFDADDDFSSIDDESFSDEDVPKENFKIYSNPLFDKEIISSKIDPHHFNADSDIIESLLNRDILTVSYPKIDYLLEEFSGELTHINLIPPGIKEADFDPEEDIHLIEELLYDNSSPRLPNESLSLAYTESFHFDHYDVPSSPRPPAKPPDDGI
ncbi:hypothetical protein Tco_1251150, partial [Tanacetum coccineum]